LSFECYFLFCLYCFCFLFFLLFFTIFFFCLAVKLVVSHKLCVSMILLLFHLDFTYRPLLCFQSINQSINLSNCQSVIFNQSIIQSINESIQKNQSINQQINQSIFNNIFMSYDKVISLSEICYQRSQVLTMWIFLFGRTLKELNYKNEMIHAFLAWNNKCIFLLLWIIYYWIFISQITNQFFNGFSY